MTAASPTEAAPNQLFAAAGKVEEFLDAHDRSPFGSPFLAYQRGPGGPETDLHLETGSLRIVLAIANLWMDANREVEQADPTAPELVAAIDRDDIIEAMSWAEDDERGRWGTQYAATVLEAHDAQVHGELLAEIASLRAQLASDQPA